MGIGLPVDKNILNARIGNLCWEIRRDLDDSARIATVLAAMSDSDLTALGFTGDTNSGDIKDLRGAVAALKKTHDLFYGLDTQPAAVNLSPYTDKLTGLQ